MYLLSTPTTIEWVLGANPNTLLFSDLNLVITNPDGESTFLVSPIAEEDFTAPTDRINGLASYVITPDIEGLWQIEIVTGTSDSHKMLSRVKMQVQNNVTEVTDNKIA